MPSSAHAAPAPARGDHAPPDAAPVEMAIPGYSRIILARAVLDLRAVPWDKHGSTSTLLGLLAPVIRAACRSKYGDTPGTRMRNCGAALFGRTMVGVAVKR